MGDRQEDEVSVYRVTDYASADMLAALDLYHQMIPVEERQGTAAEVVAQLENARQRRAEGICQFEDYHFVAKLPSGVCGYMQLFYHFVDKFAFISFVAVRPGLSLGKQMMRVTSCMLEEVARQLAHDRGFRPSDRIFVELDDPGRATSEKQRRRGVRRITRFATICQHFARDLRLLEFDYLQARLGLPADWSGPERPHLLGIVSNRTDACLDGETVRSLLRFIYTRLNPEGVYDGDAGKDALYRAYLNELCAKECARVPAAVPLLTAGEIGDEA
jgi:hypothetical protein